MKTLLVLTLLVAIVGLGVWNSPKAVHEPAPYVTETHLDKLGGEIQVLSDGTITGQQPWQRECTKEWAEWWGEGTPQWAEYTAGRAKAADEIAKQEAEWPSDVFLPGAEMQDHHVTTNNVKPESGVQYIPPIQDEWFERSALND